MNHPWSDAHIFLTKHQSDGGIWMLFSLGAGENCPSEPPLATQAVLSLGADACDAFAGRHFADGF